MLHQGAGVERGAQGPVSAGMARPGRANDAERRTTEQREIADQIEQLVASWLVAITRRARRVVAIAVDDHRREIDPAGAPGGQERPVITRETERACGRDAADEIVATTMPCSRPCADARMVERDRHRHVDGVCRRELIGRAIEVDRERSRNDEARLGWRDVQRQQRLGEPASPAVEQRDLASFDRDRHTIPQPQTADRREQMLDQIDRRSPCPEGHAHAVIRPREAELGQRRARRLGRK